jgi:uncharacterized DUF497 family protein
VRYLFDWDPRKARLNQRKHGVSFDRAASLFLDPRAISIPDEEHSEGEERWVTLGLDLSGDLLAAVHLFEQLDETRCAVRIISARAATINEVKQYNEGKR